MSSTHYRNSTPPKSTRWVTIFIGIALIGVAIWLINMRKAHAVTTDREQTEATDSSCFSLSVDLPSGTPSQIVDYKGYTASFNRNNHTPNFVAWELTSEETNGTVPRLNKFMTDNSIEGSPNNGDYTRSGYDRGHMVPANDMKWSEEAMNDCFYMTNICPQDHDLNNGAWKTLEKKEQDWALRDGKLYIIAGPIYNVSDKKRIGDTGVRVPSSFFKVIVSPTENRGIGFIYPNSYSPGNMKDYSCSIDQIEEITGYNFFPDMSPELESKIEAVASFKEWNQKTIRK